MTAPTVDKVSDKYDASEESDYCCSTDEEKVPFEEKEGNFQCSVQVERYLGQFYDYFTGPDCGRKPKSIAEVVGTVADLCHHTYI